MQSKGVEAQIPTKSVKSACLPQSSGSLNKRFQ